MGHRWEVRNEVVVKLMTRKRFETEGRVGIGDGSEMERCEQCVICSIQMS